MMDTKVVGNADTGFKPDVTVRSVEEFIGAISRRTAESGRKFAYYRGENRDFGDTRLTASGLRRTQYNMEGCCTDFYKQVFDKITPNEEKHFLAFCQHHDIPTNLLDVTENALIALYFACAKGQQNESVAVRDALNILTGNEGHWTGGTNAINEKHVGSGFIYCFQDTFADATKLIDVMGLENPLSLYLREGQDRERMDLLEQILKWNDSRTGLSMWEVALDDFFRWIKENRASECIKLGFLFLMEKLPHLRGYYEQAIKSISDEAKRSNMKAAEDYIEWMLESNSANNIADLLNLKSGERSYLLLSLICSCWDCGNRKSAIELMKFLPYAIYRPLLSFSRAVAQRSCFIYQWHYSFLGRDHFFRIFADFTLEIPHDCIEPILKTLDSFGINQATIFGDYDSIAAHVLQTYEWKKQDESVRFNILSNRSDAKCPPTP
ncbi:MAG: FRG domain-containing protein [Oscillospiraceae bacterium]|jgi:hypothetical protein|nr:FRG domain-containing protein [Oscillospiraceae bacterium]